MRGSLLAVLVLSAASLHAAEPAPIPRSAPTAKFGAPIKVKSDPIPEGGYVDFTIDVPKGASVIWRISPAPVQRSTGLPSGRLVFGGKKGTTYTATAIVVDFDKKEVTDADYEFTFAGTPVVNPPPKPPDPKPKDPPTSPTDTFYFLVVRADGPATSQFTKVMADPAWSALRQAGHRVKDKTVSEAAAIGITLPNNISPPAVVTLVEDDKNSRIVRQAIALPTVSAAILDLPKGVK